MRKSRPFVVVGGGVAAFALIKSNRVGHATTPAVACCVPCQKTRNAASSLLQRYILLKEYVPKQALNVHSSTFNLNSRSVFLSSLGLTVTKFQ